MRERSDKRKPMTKRTKIAPTLTRCLPAWIERTLGTRSHREAAAELRALLAVARAAENVRKAAGDDGRGSSWAEYQSMVRALLSPPTTPPAAAEEENA